METIGEKIAENRKRQGLTQEALSELSSINLRTLQRIEKGKTVPRSHTLQNICDALDLNLDELSHFGKKEDMNFLIYMHLSVICGLFFSFADIIVPLILWLTKRDDIKWVDSQGANLISFRIVWNIIVLTTFFFFILPRYFVNIFVKDQSFLLLVICFFILHILVSVVYPIYAAYYIRSEDDVKFFYPSWLKIIKPKNDYS